MHDLVSIVYPEGLGLPFHFSELTTSSSLLAVRVGNLCLFRFRKRGKHTEREVVGTRDKKRENKKSCIRVIHREGRVGRGMKDSCCACPPPEDLRRYVRHCSRSRDKPLVAAPFRNQCCIRAAYAPHKCQDGALPFPK